MDKYKITAEEFAKNSIARLATHPNTSTAYGERKMSDADLKKRFDAQGELFRKKLNAFIDLAMGEDDGDSLSEHILTGIEQDHTLGALFRDIVSEGGKFAGYLSVGDMTLLQKIEELVAQIERQEELTQEKIGSATDDMKSEMEHIAEEQTDHVSDRENPHKVNAEQVGLGNVDNTADMDKPISDAVRAALDTCVKFLPVDGSAWCYVAFASDPNGRVQLAQQANVNSIARRYTGGRLRVGDPVEAADAVSRGFADGAYVGKSGDQVIGGGLSVGGDLYVAGSTFAKDMESLTVRDAVIVANADGVLLSELSGYVIRVSEDAAYGILYDPAEDCVKIGLGGFDGEGKVFTFHADEAQPLATRGEIADGNFPVWDAGNKTFIDGGLSVDELRRVWDETSAALEKRVLIDTSEEQMVYIVDHEKKPAMKRYASSNEPYSLIQRDGNNRATVQSPVNDLEIANKIYVDEAKESANAYTDEKVGDIETALDAILAMQEALIGGEGA